MAIATVIINLSLSEHNILTNYKIVSSFKSSKTVRNRLPDKVIIDGNSASMKARLEKHSH